MTRTGGTLWQDAVGRERLCWNGTIPKVSDPNRRTEKLQKGWSYIHGTGSIDKTSDYKEVVVFL